MNITFWNKWEKLLIFNETPCVEREWEVRNHSVLQRDAGNRL